ncbi:MAG: penicillin-binding protein 1A [Bradymonadia bacterium]
MSTPRPLLITNRRKGGFLRWIPRLIFMLGVAGTLAGGLAGVWAYIYFAEGLPGPPTIEGYDPPTVSAFFARDGRQVAELTTERRLVVPLEQMPTHLIEAFLASEDKSFFQHSGVDFRGIARAAVANFQAGRIVEGASTITQQLCKTLLSTEKSFVRKAKEAILARRTEHVLSKLDILYLYLNQIYLGHGAYGVQAAAQNYFDKDVSDLTLGESSMIAGLPPSPGRITPILNWEKARERQRRVLDRMVQEGFIESEQADAAFAQPLKLHRNRPDLFGDHTPYYTEHARRAVQGRYGEEKMYRKGLRVHLAVDADRQTAGQGSLREGLLSLGQRHGFVGVFAHLGASEQGEFAQKAAKHYGEGPLEADRYYLALVKDLEAGEATVQVGVHEARLPLKEGMAWAAPHQTDAQAKADGKRHAKNNRRIKDAGEALRVGDVISVRLIRGRKAENPADTVPTVVLSQVPKVQGALVSMDPWTGYVEAMVGGLDFDQSEYNRAFQGCRQPGSVFKPLVYSRAVDLEYTLATLISDVPVARFDDLRGELWKPKNISREYEGEILLWRALINSKNIPAINVFEYVTGDEVVRWANSLGITTPLDPGPALALGSSCVYPWDMVQVYGLFALRGLQPRPVFITRVEDRWGGIYEDHTALGDPWAPTGPKLDAMLRRAGEPRVRLVSADTAFLVQHLLKSVVDAGTGAKARSLKKVAGGKTGTTNAYDVWFVGFTESLITGVWLGADVNARRLGDEVTGSRVALPVWLAYMKRALAGIPQGDFTADPPEGVVFEQIDIETGLLAAKGRRSVRLPFKAETAPTEKAKAAGTFDTSDLDDVEGRF